MTQRFITPTISFTMLFISFITPPVCQCQPLTKCTLGNNQYGHWRMATRPQELKPFLGPHPFLRDKDADEDAAALRLLLFVGGDAD
jgi:hypothetical protein